MPKKQLTIGAIISYLAILFNVISGLIYTPWMINVIGKQHYALYTLALSIISLFMLDFGIGSAITKFLANYYAKRQYEEANQFMGIVYKIFIVISFFIAITLGVFYLNIEHIYVKLSLDELAVFKNLFIIVSVYSVLSFPFTSLNGILMANECFIEIKTCNLGQKILNVLLIVLFLMSGYGVYSLVLINAITNIVFLTIKYWFVKKKTKQGSILAYWNKDIARNIFSFSIWTTIMNIAHRCIFNIMPTIIASIMGSIEVAIFSLAITLESYVFMFADAINGMFMPRISRILVKQNSRAELEKLMINVGRFHVFTIGLIYLGFILHGKEFINLWLGTGYQMVYWCSIVIIFPSILSVPQQVARTALLAKDYVKDQAVVYLIMATINLCMSYVLLPKYGILGAASSICISYLFRFLGMNYLYVSKLSLNVRMYFKHVYVKWIVVFGVSGAIDILMIGKINVLGWFGLLLKCFILTIVYSILYIIFYSKFKNISNLIKKESRSIF